MGEFPVSNPSIADPLLSPANTELFLLFARIWASSIPFTGIISLKLPMATLIVVLALKTSTIMATSSDDELLKLRDTFIATPKIGLEKKNS
jgi:hypothetical protein